MNILPWKEIDYYNNKLKDIDLSGLKKIIFKLMDDYQILIIEEHIFKLAKKDDVNSITKFTQKISSFRKEGTSLIKKYLQGNKIIHKKLGVVFEEINEAIFFSNLIILYFFNKNLNRIINVKDFILDFMNKSYNYFSPICIEPSWNRSKSINNNLYKLHFLALKWFYSKETKHLYPKDLLNKMRGYEEEIKGIKLEDCIKKPSKYFRLLK